MGARNVDEETIRRWISENGGSPGGSSYLPLDLTDDVTQITNTADASLEELLSITEGFVGFRTGDFDASHLNGGCFESNNNGWELSVSDAIHRSDGDKSAVLRAWIWSLVSEVISNTYGTAADFQLTAEIDPNTFLGAFAGNQGDYGAQSINIVQNNVPQSEMSAYDLVNQSELHVFADKVIATFAEKNGDPDETDIPDGFYGVYKNTSGGAIKLWVNDGGSFKSVALT